MAVEQQERTRGDESLEVAALRRQLAEQERKFTNIITEKNQALAEKEQVIASQSRQITEMEEYQHQVHTVLTNQGMSHRDRVTWCVAHILYGPDIMAGRPFHADMAKIQKMAGVGKNATGELFSAMVEAGGVKHDWDREKYQPEESDTNKWASAVMITAMPGNALVNTKDTEIRARQREASAKSATRRIERLVSVAIEACPNCGCEDPEMAQTLLVPRCKACGKLRNSDNLVQTSALRIVEVIEEPVQNEIDASSVQDASSQELPTSQDTPSMDDYASEQGEIPDEPAHIKAQYEEVSPDRETSNAVPMTMPTTEDERTFKQVVMQVRARGLLDAPHGQSVFTYRDVLHDLQEIIRSREPVKVQTMEWVRSEMAQILNNPFSSQQVEGSDNA